MRQRALPLTVLRSIGDLLDLKPGTLRSAPQTPDDERSGRVTLLGDRDGGERLPSCATRTVAFTFCVPRNAPFCGLNLKKPS